MIKKSLLSKVLLSAGTFLIAFMLMEITLRIMGYHPLFIQMDMFIEQDNDLLPYTLKPNYRGYQVGKDVTIDASGNRVVKNSSLSFVNNADDASSKTVLILGDSVVFGFGLRDEETIASQLQQLVHDKDINYIIKNIGVPGYTTWNEYEALRQYLENNKVDTVVLVYIHNDITLDNNALIYMKQDKLTRHSPFKRFVLNNFYIATLIQKIKIMLYYRDNAEQSSEGNTDTEAQLKKKYLDTESFDYSMQAMSKIKMLCEEKDIELIVTLVRLHFWYDLYPDFSNEFESEFLTRLNHMGVRAFIAASHTENLSMKEINVYRNDPHPSALAVKYIVEDIYQQIADDNRP